MARTAKPRSEAAAGRGAAPPGAARGARGLALAGASSPTVRPGGRSRTCSSASSTPGTNASREVVSCRIVSVSPAPPKMTSWCATRPGRRTEWIAGLGSHARRRRLRRARRRVALRLRVELDDLGAWEHLRRLLREPHHQHGALSEVRRVEARDAGLARRGVDGVEVEPGRPDHDGHAGREARARRSRRPRPGA